MPAKKKTDPRLHRSTSPALATTLLLLGAAVLAAGLLPGGALAAHPGPMTSYTNYAVEHDDQGRSFEPDGLITSVLGPTVSNSVADPSLTGTGVLDALLPPTPPLHSNLIAPGCSDDFGRQTSGLCAMGIIAGMTGADAPGRFSLTKTTPVRFLDARVSLAPPGPTNQGTGLSVDLNAKFVDLGLIPTPVPDFTVVGPTSVWAWHGLWTDLNGNGVIDTGNVAATNEFTWEGTCAAPHSGGVPVGAPLCSAFTSYALIGWAYPGGHNAFAHPDHPGLMYLCPNPPNPLPPQQCGNPLGDTQGDTLNENPNFVTPDWTFVDQTGEPAVEDRGWFVSSEYPVWHYDHSVITSYTTVVATNPVAGGATGYLPQSGTFVDVDRYRSWNPAIEGVLNGVVKPTARANWVAWCSALVPPPTPPC
jgi:hypothetical protein